MEAQCQNPPEAGWLRIAGKFKVWGPKGIAKAAVAQAMLGAPGEEGKWKKSVK